jgi:peroxiredoxin
VLGISAQTTAYQQEFVRRFQLPFPLLSDAEFRFTRAIGLPTFVVAGERLLHRIAIVAAPDGVVRKVFDDIDSPANNARHVLAYLRGAGLGAGQATGQIRR